MVKIRLRRTGKKKQPSYRVVVADVRSPRDGRFIENIGHYNPLTDPATVVIDEARALYWLLEGAQPTDSVARLMRRLGTLEKLEKVKAGATIDEVLAPEPEEEEEEPVEEEAPAAEVAPEPAEQEVAEAPEAEEELIEEPTAEAPEVEEEGVEEPTAEEAVEEPETEEEKVAEPVVEAETAGLTPTDVPLSELGLSTRVENVLEEAGLSTVGAVIEKIEKGEALDISGFGEKSLEEVRERLRESDYLGE